MRRQSTCNVGLVIIFSFFLNKLAYSDDLCLLPSNKKGFCRGIFPRWSYDPNTGTCNKFYWGGCLMGSNENRFDYQYQCTRLCQVLSCSKKYQALGCYTNYRSVAGQPRGKELLNERDLRNKAFNGTLINWIQWSEYLPGMLCRCAERVAGEGFGFFSIHKVGECWGTNDYQSDMLNKTSQCWDRFYGQQCSSNKDICVGGPTTYYYYTLT